MSDVPEQRDPSHRNRSVRAVRLWYAVAAWGGMVVLAILNATFRELVITPTTGTYPAHVLSTATLLVLLGTYVYLYFRRMPSYPARERVAVGVLWAGLTVAFELVFGHYVAGDSWAELLALYDVTRGYVWVLVPLFLLLAPTLYERYTAG